jgi:hypothetical protein
MTLKKERADSKLGKLSQEQRAELRDLLLDAGCSLVSAQKYVRENFGVSVGTTALHHFFQRVCLPVKAARLNESAEAAEKITDENSGAFDAATNKMVKQLCFEAMSAGADADTLSKLMGILLTMRDQEIKREKLKLDTERFQWDAAEAAMEHAAAIKLISADGQMGSEEKRARVIELVFGKKPGQ